MKLRALLFVAVFVCAQLSAQADILITNVQVWNGTADRATAQQQVWIQGKLIRAVGESLDPPPDVKVVDGRGGFLMPGIIDAHTHIATPIAKADSVGQDPAYVAARSLEVARMLLMRGWTTLRDVGGPSQGIAKAIDEGHAVGPRIYPSAAYISQTSGHGDSRLPSEPHPNLSLSNDAHRARYRLIADGPAEVRRAVREALRVGAVQVKLMAGGGISTDNDPLDTVQYSLEELRAAVESAADWHTYVTVHAYTDEAVNRALDAGVKVIEHGHLLTRPTLERIQKEGAFLSSQSFGFVRSMELNFSSRRARKAQQVLNGVDSMMTAARELGLPVAFGTDAFGSPETFRRAIGEFGYRLRWFTPLEILRQATSHNGRLLQLTGPRNPYPDGPLGVIEPGAYADLIVVDGNPLADISLLEQPDPNIRIVMKDGVFYKGEESS